MQPDAEGALAPPALELVSVRAGYGRIEVLHGVDLVVPQGSTVALLGPNGAGKSTTLGVAAGQVEARSGCVHVGGRHVNGVAPEALARAGVCTVPEGRGVFPNLSVLENLRMATFAGSPLERVGGEVFARFPVLWERRDQLAGTLSGGEQQLLALVRALATRPGLLLLDEISMSLAPRVVEDIYALVSELAAAGAGVLLVEQFATTALRVADYVAVMVGGRVVSVGEPEDVRDELSTAYLGRGG